MIIQARASRPTLSLSIYLSISLSISLSLSARKHFPSLDETMRVVMLREHHFGCPLLWRKAFAAISVPLGWEAGPRAVAKLPAACSDPRRHVDVQRSDADCMPQMPFGVRDATQQIRASDLNGLLLSTLRAVAAR